MNAGSLPALLRWPGYLAWAFLTLIALAVLTVRAGQWQQGLLLYALACLASLLVLVWYAAAVLLPRNGSRRGAIALRALPALPGALLLVSAMATRDVPPIHDITTDLEDPPRFEAVIEARGPKANSLAIDPEVQAQQAAAYPELATLYSSAPYGETFDRAEAIARALGWELLRSDRNAGFIEAVDTTAIMAFKDDIVIRVRSGENGSSVDLRSASRVGVSDLGANAARLRAFAERFQAGT
ncbi:DUF1499 domain-containing protein [Pseudohaliea rubra]|uniref:DUF1499 domain-containing protein n=1 Tax=Pseudohaliea rubra DSM 19751 TaxID=1265313 RepID=A0A095VV65_9GAMM|nr:DUF1499 domain-containing protein [Pseudohaliea rubra]KGE05362.1 hypothetical protein HRUBRA_00042 [Pseudohaliea rubra DSM 19751]